MKFNILNITCVSVTVELDNDKIYQVDKEYDVYLNEEKVKTLKENVFTIFDLKPNYEYSIRIDDDVKNFKTLNVDYILHTSNFIKGDSQKDDTLRLQAAINMTPSSSLLVFDEKEYHISSLFLKSDITIYLKKDVKIFASTDIDDYSMAIGEIKANNDLKKPLELLSWEGNPLLGKTSIICGYNVKNVNLIGEGIIDGQADKSTFWHDVKNLKWGRPRLLFLNNCDNIKVIGLTFKNTPCWTIHPFFSSNLEFYNLFISNPKDSPNTDGMDPESCENLKIIGVKFSVGDDCIALKSGKKYIGSLFKKPTEHVLIRNCFMNEGHGAIVLGSEVGAGLKDLLIERCYFKHTDRGLRIKSRRGRGKDSVIDDVTFSNIIMDNVLTPLTINMFYFCDPDGKSDYVQNRNPRDVDDDTPYLGKFTFKNIKATDCEVALGYFLGLPEQKIGEIEIIDSTFTMKENSPLSSPIMACNVDKLHNSGFHITNVKKVKFHNVKTSGYTDKELILDNVDEVIR